MLVESMAGGPKGPPYELLAAFDEAFNRRAWHGATLLQSIRGVNKNVASWRPAANRHNIWEVVVHAAFWKHVVRERLTGKKDPTFPYAGRDWFVCPSDDRMFKADVALIKSEHQKLRKVIAGISRAGLEKPLRGRRHHTASFTIRGITAHDLYHAGQIQLLKALARRT